MGNLNNSYVVSGGNTYQTSNKQPKLIDLNTIKDAGIDPCTGLPIKIAQMLGSKNACGCTKPDIKKVIRIVDEQNAINRFKWVNLPEGLDSRLIERILYYRGQAMFFKMGNRFMVLPYTLQPKGNTSGIDCYGRYTSVTPLPFNGTSQINKNGSKEEKPWIQGLVRDCIYDIQTPLDYIDEETGEILVDKLKNIQENGCVLLKDYSEQLPQHNIPRQQLQDPIIDLMSDMYPFMRTALLSGTGVKGMRVVNENDYTNVLVANQQINNAALTGQMWIPIVGSIEFQDLTDGQLAKAEEYLLAMQSLDNFRLGLYGLQSGGIFEKQSQVLQDEYAINSQNNSLVFKDSLKYRQDQCTIINSIWGLDIWCMEDETLGMNDFNGDGMIGGDFSDANYLSTNNSESEMEGNEDNV